MKQCPLCGRAYDLSMSFCLDDGAELLYGPGSHEATTVVLGVSSHEPTQVFTSQPSEVDGTQSSSIAVLPFKNISTDPDNEYFCEGLAEEILNALAKIRELKVAARTSAFSFRDRTTDVSEIGRKLGVATILEGSVRKSGDRLRISVQLVNASAGYHMWSETYDRMMSDIFDVQDEITLAVVDALKLKLLGTTITSVLRRETENTEAYKAYLRGRYLRYAKNDHARAAVAFEEALRLDPRHAPSWVALAENYVLRAHYALLDPRESCLKAGEALAKARAIQGETGEAFYVRGFAAFIERDWANFSISYRRSIELDPNNSRALGTFGVINCVRGNLEEALDILSQACEVDPFAPYPYAMTACGLAAAGRSNESIPYFEQAFGFDRDHPLALWAYCVAVGGVGKFTEGIDAGERAVTASHRSAFCVSLLGWALAKAGRIEEGAKLLAELRERPTGSPIASGEVGLLAALGDTDAALDLYSRAIEEHAPTAYYVGLACFDDIRDDPRFKEILDRAGLFIPMEKNS